MFIGISRKIGWSGKWIGTIGGRVSFWRLLSLGLGLYLVLRVLITGNVP